MKKLIFILTILLTTVSIFSYEFKILPIAGEHLEWSNIAQYKDSVYYHIFSYDNGTDRYSAIHYVIGDTFVSTPVSVNDSAIVPYNAEIASDTAGKAYICWLDEINTKQAVVFEICDDTTFNFYNAQLLDTLSSSADVFHTNLTIDVTKNGECILVAYNKVYYQPSGDSIIVDSVHIYYLASGDYGTSFIGPRKLDTPGNFSILPNAAWDNTTKDVHIIYSEVDTLGNQFIYANSIIPPYLEQETHSIDSRGISYEPVIAWSNDTLFTVYPCYNQNNNHVNIKMKLYNTTYNVPLDTLFVAQAPRKQSSPQLVIDNNGAPLIAFYDSIDNNTVSMYSSWNGSSFDTDWMLWQDSAHIKRPEIVFFNPTHVYFNLLVPNSGDVYSYILSAKPDRAPDKPVNIRVNGDTLFSWYKSKPFNVQWTYTYDYSSVYKSFVRVFDPPTDNYDTTFTVQDSTVNFQNPPQGVSPVYIWLMDYRGNLNYNKNGFALIKYDSIPPNAPSIIGPADSSRINSRNFTLNFHSAKDTISGIEHYSIFFDTLRALSTPSLFNCTDTMFFIDTSLFAEPFRDGRYFWMIEAFDSALNISRTDTFQFILEATKPVMLMLPQNGDSIDMPYDFTIQPINDFDSDIHKYRFQFSYDSLFNDIVLDTVFGDTSEDTVLALNMSDYDSLYWRARAINKSGYECRYSPKAVFYERHNIPDSLHINVLFSPDSLTEGDSLNIMSYSNKPELDYSQSYLYGENMGQRMLTFNNVFPDTLYFSNYTLPNSGIKDTMFTLFIKAVDADSMVDSFTAYIDFYTSLIPLDISLHVLPEQPLIGDTLRITIHSNKEINNINVFTAEGNNLGSVDILPVADTSSFNYRGKFATEGLQDSIIKLLAAAQDMDGLQDTTEIAIKIRFPEIWIEEKNVYIWPNPADGNTMNVRIHAMKQSGADIDIFDLRGNSIFQQNVDLVAGQTRDVNIDITDFKSDMYFMLISITDNEETYSFKRKFTVIR